MANASPFHTDNRHRYYFIRTYCKTEKVGILQPFPKKFAVSYKDAKQKVSAGLNEYWRVSK